MVHESPCHLNRAAKLEHVCYGIGAKTNPIEKRGSTVLVILTIVSFAFFEKHVAPKKVSMGVEIVLDVAHIILAILKV